MKCSLCSKQPLGLVAAPHQCVGTSTIIHVETQVLELVEIKGVGWDFCSTLRPCFCFDKVESARMCQGGIQFKKPLLRYLVTNLWTCAFSRSVFFFVCFFSPWDLTNWRNLATCGKLPVGVVKIASDGCCHRQAVWQKLDVEKKGETQSRCFCRFSVAMSGGPLFFSCQNRRFFFVPGVVPSEELAMVLASAEIDMTRTELWKFCLDSVRMVESCNGQLRESYAESSVNCALVNLASRMQIDALVEAVDTKAPWQSDESQGNSCHNHVMLFVHFSKTTDSRNFCH